MSFLEILPLNHFGFNMFIISEKDVKGGLFTPDLHTSQEHLPVSQAPVRSPLHVKNSYNLQCPRQFRDQLDHLEIPGYFPCLLWSLGNLSVSWGLSFSSLWRASVND